MDVDIGVPSFDLTNQVADRFAFQRSDQISARQDTADDSSSNGDAKFGRTEQEGYDGTILPSSAKMNMGLGHPVNISNH